MARHTHVHVFFFLILEKLIRSGVGLSHSHEMGIINLMKKRKMQFKENWVIRRPWLTETGKICS